MSTKSFHWAYYSWYCYVPDYVFPTCWTSTLLQSPVNKSYSVFIVNIEPPTLFSSSDKTFSKVPNGIATDVGTPTHEGNFPFRYAIFRDLAPTWYQKCECYYNYNKAERTNQQDNNWFRQVFSQKENCLMHRTMEFTISSENSSADIAYFPRNFFLTNETAGTAWSASAFEELDCWSSLAEISLSNSR